MNKNFKILLLTEILVFLFFSVGLCQTQKLATRQELIVWQQRVDGLTEGITNDSKSIDEGERAIYLALLAKLWWKTNPSEARKYAEKAASLTVEAVDSSNDTDLIQRLQYSQKVIQIIAGFDSSQSQLLTEKLTKILESKGNSGNANADSLVLIALQLVDRNPRLAFVLGARSLFYGNSIELHRLVRRLNSKDTGLAENLFQLSLAAAQRKYNYEFISSFGNLIFQNGEGNGFSDAAKRSYLEMLAGYIRNAVLVESERSTRCEVVTLATPILAKFDEYLPSQSQTIRQEVQICIPFSHPFTQEIAKAETDDATPQTADEFIQAARDTNDPGLKGHYLYKAISKLELLKQFDKIISLLDNMSKEEINAIGQTAWDSWRIEYAFRSALRSFENGDLPAVYHTIDRTPANARPYVRFRLVFKLSSVENRAFILENLEAIKKELASFQISEKDAATSYISLTRLYIKNEPLEAIATFQDAVKFINKTDSANPDFLPEKDYSPLDDYIPLPYELLTTDEFSIHSSLTNISSRRSRIRLKLGLLESSLGKLENLKTKKIEQKEMEQKEQKH